MSVTVRPVTIRPATVADLPALGAMAASLVRLHHGIDPARFFLANGVEEGYRKWLGRELGAGEAIVLVAETAEGAVAGYAYGRIEERDWNMLLDRHAALHDVFVAEGARRSEVGRALVERFCALVHERGVPRVVLHTAASNAPAQALFSKLGFRTTMLEMTCELAPRPHSGTGPSRGTSEGSPEPTSSRE